MSSERDIIREIPVDGAMVQFAETLIIRTYRKSVLETPEKLKKIEIFWILKGLTK